MRFVYCGDGMFSAPFKNGKSYVVYLIEIKGIHPFKLKDVTIIYDFRRIEYGLLADDVVYVSLSEGYRQLWAHHYGLDSSFGFRPIKTYGNDYAVAYELDETDDIYVKGKDIIRYHLFFASKFPRYIENMIYKTILMARKHGLRYIYRHGNIRTNDASVMMAGFDDRIIPDNGKFVFDRFSQYFRKGPIELYQYYNGKIVMVKFSKSFQINSVEVSEDFTYNVSYHDKVVVVFGCDVAMRNYIKCVMDWIDVLSKPMLDWKGRIAGLRRFLDSMIKSG